MQVVSQLDSIIAEHHLLKHAFYQAWSKGELSMGTLKTYAAQYYHQVQSFPRFISRVHTGCPHIKARKLLLENLIDEELHGTDHPALWMQFAEGLGATHQAVLDEKPLAETQIMVDKFYELAERDWRDGLCALYAYESQVPAVSSSKMAGLKDFYEIGDQRSLEFFTAHEAYDVQHARQVAELIEQYVDPTYALQATREAAVALTTFLDGMCRVAGITCTMSAENVH
jgi:pyrroloquinoline-quinone synthase